LLGTVNYLNGKNIDFHPVLRHGRYRQAADFLFTDIYRILQLNTYQFMRMFLYLTGFLFVTLCLKAAPPNDSAAIYQKQLDDFIDSVKSAQKYETGLISLPGGKALMDVPKGFKFLNQAQSKYVLTELWGNPPENTANTLGMIFPENTDPFTDSSYVFVVEYEDIGYVKDDDAEKINYDDLLKNIQSEEKATNEKRQKAGYPTMHLVGWAQQPYYDKENKILHWAKEIEFGDRSADNHTLNYEIRILGRHGVLSLNAVCTMHELPMVKANLNKVLHMATFTDGNAYHDFNPGIDKVAAWTVGGLVAGKILAKVGFFAIILKYLGAFWKFILLGFAALAGFFKRLFTGKKAKAAAAGHTADNDSSLPEATETAVTAEEDIAAAPGNSHTAEEQL